MRSKVHRRYDRFWGMSFWRALKFEFCQMTMRELKETVDRVIREDQEDPDAFRPLVAIGRTRDVTDNATVEPFVSYLHCR